MLSCILFVYNRIFFPDNRPTAYQIRAADLECCFLGGASLKLLAGAGRFILLQIVLSSKLIWLIQLVSTQFYYRRSRVRFQESSSQKWASYVQNQFSFYFIRFFYWTNMTSSFEDSILNVLNLEERLESITETYSISFFSFWSPGFLALKML